MVSPEFAPEFARNSLSPEFAPVFPDGTPVPPDMTWEEWERRGKPGAVY